MATYVAHKKSNINIKELSRLFNLAKGHRDITQFLIDCGISEDKNVIIDILNERINPALRVHHLRKVVQGSEYRVTLEQITKAAGIVVNDIATELKNIKIVRSGIYMCNMGNVLDSEQGGIRPVIVLANQKGLDASGIALICPLTSVVNKCKLPTHILVGYESGLDRPSEALLEQITRISKRRLLFNGEPQLIGQVPDYLMIQIETAIKKSVGVIPLFVDKEILKEYMVSIKGIEDAKRFRNTKELQAAYVILMDKFKSYCADYNINYNTILNNYKQQREQISEQREMIYNGAKRYVEVTLSTI
jgi:mRNA interferase MazF